MNALSPTELTAAIEGADLFQDLLQLPDPHVYRGALQSCRGWGLDSGDTLAQAAAPGCAYVVASGSLGAVDGTPDPRRVFGQWTALRGERFRELVSALEETILIECTRDTLKVLLGPSSSAFKVVFFQPLVKAVPAISDAPDAAVESAIKSSRFRVLEAGEPVVREGDYGNSMYFLLAGDASAEVGGNPVRTMQAGDFFGEIALLQYGQRTASVIAATPCLVMEADRGGAFELRKKSKSFKALLDERYRERAVYTQLEQCPLFGVMDEAALRRITAQTTIESFEPYEPLFHQGDVADALYITLNGTVTIVAEQPEGTVPVSWILAGSVIGEMALLPEVSGTDRRTLTATALQRVDAVRVSSEIVRQIMAESPKVSEGLRRLVEQRRVDTSRGSRNLGRQSAVGWALETEHLAGRAVLAVDMHDCIRCGNCVSACESVHPDGLNRFFWGHMREEDELLPHIRFSNSCQHCETPLCATNCPTQCIRRDPGGAVVIDYDQCIRCGKCADPSQGCPYGAIDKYPAEEVKLTPAIPPLMKLLALFSPPKEAPAQTNARTGKNYPVKCDLCHGLPYQACAKHCPTGAVFRVDGAEQFTKALTELESRAGGAATEGYHTLYLNAGFEGTPTAGRPAELRITISDSGPGTRVRCRQPEPRMTRTKLNFFMAAPEGIRIGRGGALQQLTLDLAQPHGELGYALTVPKAGAVSLPINVFQGGFYLGRFTVDADIQAPPPPPPKPAPAAPKVAQ